MPEKNLKQNNSLSDRLETGELAIARKRNKSLHRPAARAAWSCHLVTPYTCRIHYMACADADVEALFDDFMNAAIDSDAISEARRDVIMDALAQCSVAERKQRMQDQILLLLPVGQRVRIDNLRSRPDQLQRWIRVRLACSTTRGSAVSTRKAFCRPAQRAAGRAAAGLAS